MKKLLTSYIKKTSIKTKWIIFVFILTIYPIFLLGYVGYKNYENEVTKHFVESVQKDIRLVGELVLERLQDLEKFISETQYDEVIYNFSNDYYEILKNEDINLEKLKVDTVLKEKLEQAVIQDYNLKSKIEKYLNSIVLSRQDISLGAFQFAEQEHSGYLVSKEKSNSYYEQKIFIENDVFEQIDKALQGGNKTAYYIDENNDFYIGQKIYHRDTFKHSGNIIFKIEQEYVFRRYHSMLEDSKEAVYVLANGTKELVTLGALQEERKGKLETFILSNYRGGSYYTEESKDEAIVYNTFITKNLSISSAVFISLDVLLADIRELSSFISILCLSMIPLFLILANELYKEVIHPVYMLSDKMHQIERGEMGVEISNKRTDEIGYVYNAFNKMSKEIKYLVNCVYKEQIALKNAELKALQAQINPHFLYNTLEMINWQARMSGNDEISEMIEALSGIMEINIDRRESPFLTLEEEIKYLRNYIFLIQKRFGNKVEFEEYIDEKVMCYKIPRLILQPIIENAIVHGIEPVGKGTIFLDIQLEGQSVWIKIKDNGQGIDEKRLMSLQRKLQKIASVQEEDRRLEKGHIGIINVQKRVRLLYGEEYGIHMTSRAGYGTEIDIVLPATLTGTLVRESEQGRDISCIR